jgi:hypothetical protein
MNLEKKFLKCEENLLGGITLDWRHNSNWMVNKEKYKEIVKESVYNILNSSTKRRMQYIQRKIKFSYSTSFYPRIFYSSFH